MPDYVNSGILFVNKRKREAKHPSHQGSATVQCPSCQTSTKFELSAWEKQGGKGPFWSMAFKLPKPPEGEAQQQQQQAGAPETENTQDGKVPF